MATAGVAATKLDVCRIYSHATTIQINANSVHKQCSMSGDFKDVLYFIRGLRHGASLGAVFSWYK